MVAAINENNRPVLPQVTLCAASSVNVAATLRSLEVCLEKMDFSACKLFTDKSIQSSHPHIEVINIVRMDSTRAYSKFLLEELVDYVDTAYCLIVQWDGHILDGARWRDEFLDYDYIGARWPQFGDGRNVGNGGFSLRSRQLMKLCRELPSWDGEAEDVAIGRTHRSWLEGQGVRFAPGHLADMFSAERAGDVGVSFGYHGVFNMIRALGLTSFERVYRDLDDRGTLWSNWSAIVTDIVKQRAGFFLIVRMLIDRILVKNRRHQ